MFFFRLRTPLRSLFLFAHLLVFPLLVSRSEAADIPAGKTVVLTGSVSGIGPFVYRWYKNNVLMSERLLDATYTIANFQSANAGSYHVKISNLVGSTTSPSVTLSLGAAVSGLAAPAVATIPVITTQPVSKTVIAGTSVTFSVGATGSPAPTYQWLKNGGTIIGATGSTYTIASATASDANLYSVRVTNAAGTVRSSNASLAVNQPLPAHADFSGDGKADILWQNILTGEHGVWLMGGTSMASKVSLPQKTKDWEVIGVSDFNGDGRNDVLMQSLVTRESILWLMTGTTLTSSISLGVAPAGMWMVGVGDFNADGMPDILWQTVSTGSYSIRFMNGTTPGSSVVIGTGPAGWTVGGTGDFNGDRKTDILWQRASDGAARIWLMNGSAYGSANDLGTMGAGWILGGTGDFNGDGKKDILWQNTSTGACKIVLMSGLMKIGEVSLGTVPAGWIMVN